MECMNQQTISGYVCTREERVIWRYVVPIGIAVTAVLAVILLAEAILHGDSVGVWLFTLAWSAFVIYLIALYCNVRVIDHLTFSVERTRITNCWSKDNRIELDLTANYFCAMFTCEFAYGTAKISRSYYLFSEKPFDVGRLNGIEQSGFHALEKINKHRIIMIPKTELIDVWAKQVLRLDRIPQFPSAAFKQGLTES